jgi:hypothetical protein
MASRQRVNLPVTTSAIVTESTRQILGLKNFGIFAVFGVFALVQITTGWFPAAIVTAVATYTFIKRMIDSKPSRFLEHFFLYHFFLKRKFLHRPPGRRWRPATEEA